MQSMDNIDFTQLKKACAALNETEGLLAKAKLANIKTVAVKKDVLVNNFTSAVEALSGAGAEEEIPELAVEMYNAIYAEDEGGEAGAEGGEEGGGEEGGGEEAPAAKPKAKAKPKAGNKPKAGDKPKKKEVKKSPYGHVLSAISGKIDTMVAEGTTYGALCDELEINRSRVKSHLKALKNKGLTVLVKENEDWKKTTVSVKEKSL